MNGRIRAVVAEDEPLARESLVALLGEFPWLECAATAGDGREAVELVNRLRPEVLFLDVEMPGLTGLAVLEALDHEPMVIFTTAYDRYAVPAFEFGAVDYLVKPFGRRRLARALERVRTNLDVKPGGPALVERLRAAEGPGPLRRIFTRRGLRILPVTLSDVVRFEADGNYVNAFTRGERVLLGVSLLTLEERLDPDAFLRIHRSHIVNLDRIAEMRDYDERRLVLALDDGSEVVASRSGSRRLRRLIR